ncbi:MAG: DUF1127 domain-containing protein [Epibacterium sp.]|nr:DUF1127 domain-containing protein [Epibacterium sp.]
MLGNLIALRRQRLELLQMDAPALNDIGITREAALDEAHRPFWDAPNHWTRLGSGRNRSSRPLKHANRIHNWWISTRIKDGNS